MKLMREKKRKKQKEIEEQTRLNLIAKDATDQLVRNLSPFERVRNNTGPIKYSEVLKDFVKPYLIECHDFDDTKSLFEAGALAWNLASAKQTIGDEEYERMIKGVEKDSKEYEVVDFLRELVNRKVEYFSDHNVIITSVELTEDNLAFGISVAVTPINQEL